MTEPGKIMLLEEQLKQTPENPSLYLALGEAWVQAQNYPAALAIYQRAVQRFPQELKFMFNLGYVLELQGKWLNACACYEQVILQDNQSFEAWYKRGEVYQRLNLAYQASFSFWQAWQLRPTYLPAFGRLLDQLIRQGQMERVAELCGPFFDGRFKHESWFQTAPPATQAAIAKEAYRYHALFLMAHFCLARANSQWLVKELTHWGLSYFPSQARTFPPKNSQARLKIAYLSNEWNSNIAKLIYSPLFFHQDLEAFEYTAYVDNPEGKVSENLKPCFHHWLPVQNFNNQKLLAQIWQDKIDILVDLSGHFNLNRLAIFAQRAAPVQIFAGSNPPLTTGLKGAYDYRWSDRWLWPEDYTLSEPEYQLSSFIHREKPLDYPLLPCPFEKNGYFTFGSANSLNKLNPEVLALWSLILKESPQSHLMLKTPAFFDPEIQAYWLEPFLSQGIAKERLLFLGPEPAQEHIPWFYGQIDIALDPFPYNGVITSLEALWMGVPVLALRGERFQVSSVLCNLGLETMLADSPQTYLKKAIAWVQDPEQLKAWRQSLRSQIQNHAIFNGKLFAQEVEAGFMEMWQKI